MTEGVGGGKNKRGPDGAEPYSRPTDIEICVCVFSTFPPYQIESQMRGFASYP